MSTKSCGFTHNFAYDNAGNPTTFKGTSQSFNANNQRNATGFTFDGNGNPTTYGGVTCTYDAENRMTAYGSVLTNGYRADGLRAWKQVGSTRTYFLYDGGNPIIEMDSSGDVTAIYDFGPDGSKSKSLKQGNAYTDKLEELH